MRRPREDALTPPGVSDNEREPLLGRPTPKNKPDGRRARPDGSEPALPTTAHCVYEARAPLLQFRVGARDAAIAQLVEHLIRNEGVGSSNLSCGTNDLATFCLGFGARSGAPTQSCPSASLPPKVSTAATKSYVGQSAIGWCGRCCCRDGGTRSGSLEEPPCAARGRRVERNENGFHRRDCNYISRSSDINRLVSPGAVQRALRGSMFTPKPRGNRLCLDRSKYGVRSTDLYRLRLGAGNNLGASLSAPAPGQAACLDGSGVPGCYAHAI